MTLPQFEGQNNRYLHSFKSWLSTGESTCPCNAVITILEIITLMTRHRSMKFSSVIGTLLFMALHNHFNINNPFKRYYSQFQWFVLEPQQTGILVSVHQLCLKYLWHSNTCKWKIKTCIIHLFWTIKYILVDVQTF